MKQANKKACFFVSGAMPINAKRFCFDPLPELHQGP
jgi:hypothetical protein